MSASPAEVDAEAVALAVESCPSVVRLTAGGVGGQVATYLPGRRVLGVRATDEVVEVHLSSLWGVPIPDVAAEVRSAVADLVHGRPVQIAVEDVEEPAHALPPADDTPVAALGGGQPPAVPSPS